MLAVYADVLFWAALISGIVMSVSYFPQAWKQFRNKSSHNVAVITFAILLIGKIIWTFYGFQINDLPVIISNIISVIGLFIIVVLYYVYRGKNKT